MMDVLTNFIVVIISQYAYFIIYMLCVCTIGTYINHVVHLKLTHCYVLIRPQ